MIAPVIVHPVFVTEAMGPEEPTFPVMMGVGGVLVQVTAPKPPGAALRTAKPDAAPSDGAEAAAEWSLSMLERSGGALMRDAESLLHAAESSANVTTTPAANLGAASALARRIGTLCAYMWASLGLWWFSVS
jgi:hypothetical protein